MSPFRGVPPELAGELYFVRPSSVKSWDEKLHLGAWITPESVAPSTRKYLIHPVPAKAVPDWVPLPLETLKDAADRRDEEEHGSAGVRELCSEAVARADRVRTGRSSKAEEGYLLADSLYFYLILHKKITMIFKKKPDGNRKATQISFTAPGPATCTHTDIHTHTHRERERERESVCAIIILDILLPSVPPITFQE
jgi:hypothetical protein